jgi:CRP-like cAMP-binding protein
LKTKNRNATVRTVRVSKFLVLEMREFHRIASNHPLLMKKMQQINLSRASQAF